MSLRRSDSWKTITRLPGCFVYSVPEGFCGVVFCGVVFWALDADEVEDDTDSFDSALFILLVSFSFEGEGLMPVLGEEPR